MADQGTVERTSFLQHPRVRLGIVAIVLAIAGVAVWLYRTAGRVSTGDAQVDAHVTQIAARVGGTVTRVAVEDNQLVDAGTVLVELDPRDYQVAVDKARAELADAEAGAVAAASDIPIIATRATGNVATAHGGVALAQGGVAAAEREIEL